MYNCPKSDGGPHLRSCVGTHTAYARRRLVSKAPLRLPVTTDGELTVCTSYIPSCIPLRRRPKPPCELITLAAKESLNLLRTPLAVDDTNFHPLRLLTIRPWTNSHGGGLRRDLPSTAYCRHPARLHYFLLTYPRASTIFSTGLQYFLLAYPPFYILLFNVDIFASMLCTRIYYCTPPSPPTCVTTVQFVCSKHRDFAFDGSA